MVRGLTRFAFVLFGVCAICAPARAQPLTPSMEDVLQLHEIGGNRRALALSPDGGAIALMVRERRLRENDYRHALIVIDTRTGRAHTLADAGDVIISDDDGTANGAMRDRVALWSPDGRWLAYLRATNTGVELWRVRANGGRPRLVASGPGDVRRFAWFGPNLIYETAAPRAVLLAEAEAAAREGFRVDDRFDAMYALRPLPDLSRGGIWIWQAGRTRPALREEAERLDGPTSSAPGGPAPGPTMSIVNSEGARVWFDAYADADPVHRPLLGAFRQSPGRPSERCEAVFCRGAIRQVWWGDGEEAFILRTEGFARSNTAIYAWRSDTVSLVRSIEGVMQDCAFARSAIYCIEDATLQPRRVVRIDPNTGATAPLYDPNPHWSQYSRPRVEHIDVHDRYGNPSFAYLLYPADYEPGRVYPAVVVQYRARGFLNAGVGGEYPIHAFAQRGYFVVNFERPNMDHVLGTDGHDAWVRETEITNIEQKGKQSALEAIVERLAARGDIDMRRIAITGLSDGAETLYWALTHSRLFAAAVAGSPPTDPSVWALSSANNRARLARYGLGEDEAGADPAWRAWWGDMSAARHVARIRAPVLLQLSDDEALTAFPFYARMQAQNRPIEFYIYPDAHHVRTSPSQILAGQRRTLDWIDFWLNGVAPIAPTSDPDRATRWNAMRATQPDG